MSMDVRTVEVEQRFLLVHRSALDLAAPRQGLVSANRDQGARPTAVLTAVSANSPLLNARDAG
jgi:hypothetical protein